MIRLQYISRLILCGTLFTFISCSDSDDSEPEEEETIIELTTDITGFYVGSLVADQGLADASFIIRPNGANRFNGEYFGTSNFTACCNTDGNDGTLSFQVADDSLVEMSIMINSEFPACTATLNGNGTALIMEDGNVLEFDLIQNGCGVQDFPVTLTIVKIRNLD